MPKKSNKTLPGLENQAVANENQFPIVGIGASAGGLEALELFLSNVPANCGMAFVIIQHLDPTRKGLMAELLQRSTSMPVVQVKDEMAIEANCVYIIAPNKDLSLLHNKFHLLPPLAPRGLRLPIDFFFRSLADDQQENSIGVILSGMGSDGTLGLAAIKEKAGVIFVQDPKSAKFDGMPSSAINSGLADVIAPAEKIPEKLIAYLHHIPLIKTSKNPEDSVSHSVLEKIVILLRSQTGHDFSLYKKTTIYRRIERRMGLHQIDKIATYFRFLQKNPQEVELLFHELLIGVTNFFRDPESWNVLKEKVFPELIEKCPQNHVLRAWVPACATGEEAYSLAIVFKESMEAFPEPKNITLQIFATDLDQHAIERARQGLFPTNIAADISEDRLKHFFIKEKNGYQVNKSIREMIIFAPQNIIMDPPFTKLDLLSCRNLLIYLTPESQKKLLPLFHYSLNSGGYLMLGNSETIGLFTFLFSPLAKKFRIYKRKESLQSMETADFPTSFFPHKFKDINIPNEQPINLQNLADQAILQTYSPPAVLTNREGDILYINGKTGRFFEPAAGKANWNIFAMARDDLRYELSSGFKRSIRQMETVSIKELTFGAGKDRYKLSITIQPLKEPSALDGMILIVFKDIAAVVEKETPSKQHTDSKQITNLEQELKFIQIELQNTREEMQTSQEELKSANEEMQSTNEELQSTNEELTTSKEEMQSLNEELHTVNNELQSRVDELSNINNDMKNLLDSTDIATLFLDDKLRVRRFTSKMGKITNLISTDAGRPITDIASALLYPDLKEDCKITLDKLEKIEREIKLPDGNWYSVRILPYRTLENVIDGVVITFMDITIQKNLENELREKGMT